VENRILAIGYRRRTDARTRRFVPWPIARTALVLAWRKRATKMAAMVCFGIFFAHWLWLVLQLFLRRAIELSPTPRDHRHSPNSTSSPSGRPPAEAR